ELRSSPFCALGVGNNSPVSSACKASSRLFDRAGSRYRFPCGPRPSPSLACGVGSPGNDEQPGPLVGCPDVGGSKQAPLRIEPEVGQVPENSVEAEAEMAPDVLQHD